MMDPRWMLALWIVTDPTSRSTANVLTPPSQPLRPMLSRYEQAEPRMGTLFRVTLYAVDETSASKGTSAAFDRITQLNQIMSDYLDDSELNRFCRKSPNTPFALSDDLFEILWESQRLAKETEGAFDVTIGPAVRQWRRARRLKQMPTAEQIEEARRRTGHRFLALDRARRAGTLSRKGIQLDLGAIAKGYACDAALDALKRAGIPSALVDGGGGVSVGDPPPGARGWRVTVPPPPFDSSAPAVSLELVHQAVATSGDREQFFEWQGRRYSHIIDPRTAVGLTRRVQATVLAQKGMIADALATALCVMEVDKGLALIERTDGAAAKICFLDKDRPVSRESSRWRRFTR